MRNLWILFVALGVQGYCQDMADPVTATCTGGTLQVAIDQLSQASKVPLSVEPVMARSEIIAFRLKDAPLGAAMKRIAAAVDGTWTQVGSGWNLAPNNSVRDAQRGLARKNRLDALRKELNNRINPPKPPKQEVKKGEEEVDEEDYNPAPEDVVIARILLTLDLTPIADLGENGRIVYSTGPTRMQRQMRPNPAWLRLLINSHNETVKAEADMKQDVDAQNLEDDKWSAWMKRMGIDRDRPKKAIQGDPAKVILVVERGGGGMVMMGRAGIQCHLKMYDGQGNVLTTREDSYNAGDNGFMARMATVVPKEDPAKPAQNPVKSPKIEWSKLPKEFDAMDTKGKESMGIPTMTPGVREAILNPERVEPLGIVVGEGLVHCAEAKNLQMVASLPDDSFGMGVMGSGLADTVDSFLTSIKVGGITELQEDAGYILVTPSDRLGARMSRLDRSSFGALLRSLDKNGGANLDELSKYAVQNESPFKSQLGAGYTILTSPSMMSFMFGQMDWNILRFYGQLSASQKTMLEGGRSIPMGSLSGPERVCVTQMVYGASPMITIGEPRNDDVLGGIFGMAWSSMMSQGEDADYRNEPTELCPDGLPAQGFVALKVRPEYLLHPAKGGGMLGFMGSSSLQDFAIYQIMRENPAMTGNQAMPEVKEVTVGNRRILNFTFQLSRDASLQKTLNDDKSDPNAKPVAIDKLPPEVRAALDNAMATLKKLDLPFLDPSMFQGNPPVIPPL